MILLLLSLLAHAGFAAEPTAPPETPSPAEIDYLKFRPQRNFLESLAAEDTLAPLADRKTLLQFLIENKVPAETHPGFMALHQVLERMTPQEKSEFSHLLPTLTRFLRDGHSISYERDSEQYFGMTQNGSFDLPDKLSIGGKVSRLDPLFLAKTIAHELQHVYDQFVQRTWPKEGMEMRGQKVSVLFFKALRRLEPEKYEELRRLSSAEERDLLRDLEQCSAAYDEGPRPFAQAIVYGPCKAMFPGEAQLARFSLKSALDPDTGEPTHLEALLASMEREKALLLTLDRAREEIRASLRIGWTRELDLKLKEVDADLAAAQLEFSRCERDAVFREVLLRRMMAQYEWLKKKDGPEAVYDLHLAVDREHFALPAPKPSLKR